MELGICIGIILILWKLDGLANDRKWKDILSQLQRIRASNASFDKAVSQIVARMDEIEKKQPSMSDMSEIKEMIFRTKENSDTLLKESEQIAKYRSQPSGYDFIEGAV